MHPSANLAPASGAPPRSGWGALRITLLWIGLCLAVGGLGGLATAASVRTWYPTLVKPPWTPPGWLFGPVWTVLYVAMGLAAARVHLRAGSWSAARGALALFLAQLALNGAWSWVFFGQRNPLAGLVNIVLLLLAIAATGFAFQRVDRGAAWLLLPYGLWVTFATALNAALWHLNP